MTAACPLVPSDEAAADVEYGTYVEADAAESAGMGNAGGLSASGETSGEASAQTASEEPAASAEAGDTSADAYQEYLKRCVDACPRSLQRVI